VHVLPQQAQHFTNTIEFQKKIKKLKKIRMNQHLLVPFSVANVLWRPPNTTDHEIRTRWSRVLQNVLTFPLDKESERTAEVLRAVYIQIRKPKLQAVAERILSHVARDTAAKAVQARIRRTVLQSRHRRAEAVLLSLRVFDDELLRVILKKANLVGP
jgi:hypothetical protein